MRATLAAAAVVLAACAAGGGGGASSSPQKPANPTVLLATTTSFQDTGLLDLIVADFAARTGYQIRATAVGSGAALALGGRGEADVVFVHSPAAERDFMTAGNGDQRLLVMHNDFVLLKPLADPAHVSRLPAFDALRTIAAAKATFVSRGDQSGTDVFEKGLWKQAGVTPAMPWYLEAATGMGQTLQIASEKNAYTLSDRGTFLARRGTVQLAIVAENEPPLLNFYHVITLNTTKFPRVNAAGANAFAEYLLLPETQRLIGSFGLDKYGQPLFVPDAGKVDPTP